MNYTEADKKSINYFLKRLDGFLEADNLQIAAFDRSLQRFVKRFNPKIGLIDFKYFDEYRLKKVRREIERQERLLNFGYLNNLRNLEQICLNYVEIRQFAKVDKSKFLFENNYLLYCHCGTSKNDIQIIARLSTDDRRVELKFRDFEE